MAKKQVAVSLRKPPPPADLAKLVVEAVTDAGSSGPASDVRELKAQAPQADAFVVAAKPASVPGMRAVTVQLPEAVVERLLAYCRLHERELNDVVAEIIGRHLAAQYASSSVEKRVENGAERSAEKGVETAFETAYAWVRSQLVVMTSLRTRVLQFAGW
jgi:hypothetical protein